MKVNICNHNKLIKRCKHCGGSSLCQELNCEKNPNYGFNGMKAIYCSTHKKDGMIDIRHKKCKYDSCNTRPTYNYKNEKIPIYCNLHKKIDMINVVNKRCLEFNCNIIPNFNYKGKVNGKYCSLHKKDDMIDVKNKLCIEDTCTTLANYNYEGQNIGLYCTKHKKDGMINITNTKCIEKDCLLKSSYNYLGEKRAIYCNVHKKDNMIDIRHKKCITPLCDTQVTNRYNGYCLHCFIHLFPNSPTSKNYKTKETSVVESIISTFPIDKYDWITDKQIEDGCSKSRPDIRLDLGYQIIIIEIDENQHNRYDSICENKRMMQLSQDVGHRPLIIIRFNPDEYCINGSNITSCWGYNKNGISVVKKSKQKEWLHRLQILHNQIQYWLDENHKSEKTLQTVYLFYDT